MAYKMTPVTIAMVKDCGGNQTVDSYATPVDSIVITKSLEDNWKYKLTHVPTGKVILGVDTIKQGRELAVKLADFADWSGKKPILLDNQDTKVFGKDGTLGRKVFQAHKDVVYK